MQLSVIILNYNVRYFLELCLESVVKATKDICSEIIVIDNNSHDDSCQMIIERFPQVILLANKENYGFPKGNNLGVSIAKGEYVCVLNPDTVLPELIFKSFFSFEKKHPNLGIMGAQLYDGKGCYLPESKREVPSPWVALTKIFGLYKMFPKWGLFNQYYAGHLSSNETGKVSILVGAFMILRKSVYEKVGGFDEDCFMYSDDIDLSYMILKSGFDNYYNADIQLLHFKGESTQKDKLYIQRFQEAMGFFYKKHFKKSFLFSLGMKVGTFVFVRFKANKPTQILKATEQYLLFSRQQSLVMKLENSLEKQVVFRQDLLSIKSFDMVANLNKQTEIIFDTQSFSFQEIISFMIENNQNNFTYKFVLKYQDFLVGSNHSESKGEILKLI